MRALELTKPQQDSWRKIAITLIVGAVARQGVNECNRLITTTECSKDPWVRAGQAALSTNGPHATLSSSA